MIEIIQPGFMTTIQDSGRWGFQAFGVTVAGAMDRYAYRISNILVGNEPNAAALEMTMAGGIFRFVDDAYIAVCGADMECRLNGEVMSSWSAFFVPAGSELAFGYATNGCRCYLAVSGGIDVPKVLNSRSTYIRAHIGGLNGRALKAGDSLPVEKKIFGYRNTLLVSPQFIPLYSKEICVRVQLGPQDHLFTKRGLATFTSSRYSVTNEADRMGYRLDGPKIEHVAKADIISDALCPGAIQVPGHGMPIVMMSDCQTTGGYTKIGVVIGADLYKLAQAKPGDIISFRVCSEEEALLALKHEHEIYRIISEECARQRQSVRVRKLYRFTVNGKTYNVEINER